MEEYGDMSSAVGNLRPQIGSSALLEYLWASACDGRLFHFTIDVVLRGDYLSFVAKQALDGVDEYKVITPVDLAKTRPGVLITELRQSRQELLEMFLSRAVDNFQLYLVEVIRLVLQKQPRVLSERKPELTLGHILQFDSIAELTRDILESKLSSLAYEGFGAIERWCGEKTIPLLVPDERRAKLVELIALRNIIVHTRGRVDARYKAAVPSSSIDLGQLRTVHADDLFEAIELLDSVATATDAAIANKFGLQQHDVRDELARRTEQRRGSGARAARGNAENGNSDTSKKDAGNGGA